MLRALKFVAVLAVILLAYLLVWPVPVSPKAWVEPPLASYTGDFVVNNKLSDFTKLPFDGLNGPEAVIQHPQTGELYATSHGGWVVRWPAGSGAPKRWVNLGGRALGIAFDQSGNLWAANAYVGLQKVSPDGEITTELDTADGVAIRYADDLAILPDGKIYLSDASTKFVAEDWGGTLEASLLDLMEHGLYGRIIEYDPNTRQSRVVMRDLSFANGVAADPAGNFILVVETGEYRIWKYWLRGAKAGTQEVIIAGVPGFPDNIHRGQDGRFWVGLAAPRVDILDKFANRPAIRKMMQRMPKFTHPKPQLYGLVFAINDQGQVQHNLQDPSGSVYTTTGAYETDEYLYVSSLTAPFVARYSKLELGIK